MKAAAFGLVGRQVSSDRDWRALRAPSGGQRCGSELQARRGGSQAGISNEEEQARRILVAEDNEVNQQLMMLFLGKRGYEVVIAKNGTEAVERYEQSAFGVILMDLQMPGLDGLGATRAIRGLERKNGGRIPIIGCTANATRDYELACYDSGMDEYITKPVDFDKLLGMIRAFTCSAQS